MNDPAVRSPQQPESAGRLTDFGLALLLLIGLLTPTSRGAEISRVWIVAGPLLITAAAALWLLTHSTPSRRARLLGFCIIPILLLFSLLRPAAHYTYGTLLGYAAFSAVLCFDLRRVKAGALLNAGFHLVSALFLAGGALIVAGYPAIQTFLIDNYSAYRPGLLEEMILWSRKPVLTFATHSVAGFFLYLFAYLHTCRFRKSRQGLQLWAAVLFVLLCALLTSVTGIFFAALGLFQICRTVKFSTAILTAATAGLIAVAAFATGIVDVHSFDLFSEIGTFASATLLSPTNGFLGRYSGQGNLARNVAEIVTHPYSPIGIGYPSGWLIGDSGPVEYMLRGSVLLLVCMYGGLWFFLNYNLRSRANAVHLFLVVLAFELGFTILPNARFLLFLPALIVLMNDAGPDAEMVRA